MRRKYQVIAILALLFIAGCAAQKPVTAPLPIGATSQADAASYRVLADSQAFLNSIRGSVTSGKLVLNPTQKQAFNALTASYNTAEALWQTAHQTGVAADQAKAQAAVQKLQTDLGTAKGLIQ